MLLALIQLAFGKDGRGGVFIDFDINILLPFPSEASPICDRLRLASVSVSVSAGPVADCDDGCCRCPALTHCGPVARSRPPHPRCEMAGQPRRANTTGRDGSDRIGSDRIGSDGIRSDQIRSDQIRSDQIRSDRNGTEQNETKRNKTKRNGAERNGTGRN